MNTATSKELNAGDLRVQVARLQELIFDSTRGISESKQKLEVLKARWQLNQMETSLRG